MGLRGVGSSLRHAAPELLLQCTQNNITCGNYKKIMAGNYSLNMHSKMVPDSVGNLKLLYLSDLSYTDIKKLPDSTCSGGNEPSQGLIRPARVHPYTIKRFEIRNSGKNVYIDFNLKEWNIDSIKEGTWSQVVVSESYSSDGVHELELLLSFLNDSSVEACSQGDVVGILLFSGLTDSFAYLNSKEPISQAVTDIKGDIITSLQSRLYIICDEVDVDSGNKYYVQNQVTNEISAEKPVPQLVLHLLR
ncbi:hypothetical protein JHK86_043433 [Glycine max]|nr:hypothetical protein JHK86_043433 [Glycine max]